MLGNSQAHSSLCARALGDTAPSAPTLFKPQSTRALTLTKRAKTLFKPLDGKQKKKNTPLPQLPPQARLLRGSRPRSTSTGRLWPLGVEGERAGTHGRGDLADAAALAQDERAKTFFLSFTCASALPLAALTGQAASAGAQRRNGAAAITAATEWWR